MPAILLLAAAAGGCASNVPLPPYKLYPGPVRDASEVATVRADSRVFDIRIDGLEFSPSEYSRACLSPGEHVIEWQGDFWASDDRNPADRYAKSAAVEVELEKGVEYRLRAGHPESADLSRKLWIEIVDTGAVLYETDGR